MIQEISASLSRTHRFSILQLEHGLAASLGDTGYGFMSGIPAPVARRIRAQSHLWPEEEHVDKFCET